MIKYLLILFFVSAAAYIIYARLRPYIRTARRVLGFVRDARRLSADDAGGVSPLQGARRAQGGEKLVRCDSCGTWLPASRALTFRAAPNVYCSQSCLERTQADDRAPRAARKL